MSQQDLLQLVAPLSEQERRDLRDLLDSLDPQTEYSEENDPVLKIMEEIERMPPMDAPPDFSVNHDYYIHGGEKREP